MYKTRLNTVSKPINRVKTGNSLHLRRTIRMANSTILHSDVAATNIQSSADRFIPPLDFYSLCFPRSGEENSRKNYTKCTCGTGVGQGLVGAVTAICGTGVGQGLVGALTAICGTGVGQGLVGAAIRTEAKDARMATERTKRKERFTGGLLFHAQICAR